ncbi:MAG: lysylphosphatidylglycerol synthase domain-containing protein [Methylococcales bacterium]
MERSVIVSSGNVQRWLTPLAAAIFFFLAILALRHLLQDINYPKLFAEIKATPTAILIAATGSTIAGYIVYIGYDLSALAYIGRKLDLGLVSVGAYCGYAVANTVGFNIISGGAVRYRFYSRAGLEAIDIARIAIFCSVSWGIGIHIIGIMALLIRPEALAVITTVSARNLRWIGVTAILALIGLSVFLAKRGLSFQLGKRTFTLPDFRIMLFQLLIAVLDILFAGSCLYVLLANPAIPFLAFLLVYTMAILAGITSHVPGGVGVFETVLLYAFDEAIPLEKLTAALLVYRAVYYLLPFVSAVIIMIGHEARQRMNAEVLNKSTIKKI